MESLRNLRPGQSAVVAGLGGEGALRRRILDMGLVKGVHLTVQKVAPLGDPIEIAVRGYALSLRKEDAEMVRVIPDTPVKPERRKSTDTVKKGTMRKKAGAAA